MPPVDTEAEFQVLRDLFPNRDDEAGSGSPIARCCAKAPTSPVGGPAALWRTPLRHTCQRTLGERGRSKIKTLAQFIESGLWRPNSASDAIARAAAGHAGLDLHNHVGQARRSSRQ